MEGPTSSAQLHNLTSSTEYLVSVFPIYKAGVGEGLQGLATTGVCVWAQGCRGFPHLHPQGWSEPRQGTTSNKGRVLGPL